jgi:hypothetical protein
MFRRLFWFGVGALAALFGYGWLRRQTDRAATMETVDRFIDGLVDRVTAVKEKVSDTVSGAESGKRNPANDDLFE